jgi:16S rRNA (cytidine1402-2'-O)-methyltransferase
MTGQLYIVGTPIGNLEDMSARAIQVLRVVDLIAAEDTRHTGHLLRHFQVSTPQISYHLHNTHLRVPQLLERLRQGQQLALVTDAGMPGISDPGYELVQACIREGIGVVPIPGPSAAIAALIISGLPTDRFCFEGFLPVKGKLRQLRLETLQTEDRTMVLYESPHRLRRTLVDLAEFMGSDRQIAIARELTKVHETVWRGGLADAIVFYHDHEPRGEFTLVLAGQPARPVSLHTTEIALEIQELLAQGLSRSQASRQVAQNNSLPRRQVYQLALSLADELEEGL